MIAEDCASAILQAASSDPERARARVDDFVSALIGLSPGAAAEPIQALTGGLRRLRAFGVLESVCEACEQAGFAPGWPLNHHAQALIERGAYLPALGLLQQARTAALEANDTKLFSDCWALEGRVFKDLLVKGAARRPRLDPSRLDYFARRALDAYGKGFRVLENGPDAHYPAVNILSVSRLAEQEGLAPSFEIPLGRMAQGIIEEVTGRFQADPQSVQAWDHACAAEAAAYLGLWQQMGVWLEQYVLAAGNNAFALAGTLRQFELVHGQQTGNPDILRGLDLLRLALLKADGGAVQLTRAQAVRLAAPPPGPEEQAGDAVRQAVKDTEIVLEKVWGAEAGISHRRLQDVMTCARAVGRVLTQSERSSRKTIGSGFLLDGKLVSEKLAGEILFFTNAHVVSGDYTHSAAAIPGDAWVTFDASPDLGELALDDLLWASHPNEHDAAIFRLKPGRLTYGRLRKVSALMKLAKGLPHLHQVREERMKTGGVRQVKVPTTVYIIGYPGGEELSYSMRDNELVDQENVFGQMPGPEPRRLHYRAPTEPGNSGSPVFNSRTLELIGIHHAGGKLNRLNGHPGTYDVNEGLWLQPLLAAFRAAN